MGEVLHGFERRGAGPHAGGDIDLRGLDDHDGVVDHQADGQHQPQQRDDVDREAQQREEREGPDERDGDRHERDDGRPPVLDEEVDDEDHQDEGDHQRVEYVPDTGVDAGRGVDDRGGRNAVGHAFFEPCHRRPDLLAHLHGVAAGLLVDDDHGRGLALEERAHAVALAAERNLGHIAQPDLLAFRSRDDHDVAKLRGGGDLRRHGHRISIGGAVGRGFGPELPGGVDASLVLDGRGDGRNRDAVVFQHVGLEPYAHGVLAGAHDRHFAYAVDLEQLVLEVDVSVVGEELGVVASVAVQREDQQEAGHGLARGDALLGDRRRELCGGRRDVVLREDGVQVGVGAYVEGHLHDHRTVVGAGGLQVEHVAHAHDALRHGRRHGVVDRLGIGAVVRSRDLDHGRRDVGVLFDRQVQDRNQPHDDDDDGQRQGEDRARNEKFLHGVTFFRG